MRGKANIFELHKDGKCVMTGTSKELGVRLGVGPRAVTVAYTEGYNCKGYEVILQGHERINLKRGQITPEMWQQWDDICMQFRRA